METIGPSALIVGILYVLSRWALSSVQAAESGMWKGRPDLTWRVSWTIALLVSAGAATSAHVWLLNKAVPGWEVFVFNAIVFGGFFVGFFVTGQYDHKLRVGIRPSA